MKSLADKAYNLSVKYDLGEEAKLIQIEEQKLTKLIQDNLQPIDFDPATTHAQSNGYLFDQTTAAQSIKYMDDLMGVDKNTGSSEKPLYSKSYNFTS